jgi:Zn-dependent M32 family carboxypeptidase
MTELLEPAEYVQRKVKAMSQSILDACVQHFETGMYDDDLVAAFQALRDVMIALISRVSPADQREVVRTLQKDCDGWPAHAEEINARDRERLRRH